MSMRYAIRIKDGQLVATHIGNLAGLQFPDDEAVEIYDDAAQFEARLAELAPDMPEPERQGENDLTTLAEAVQYLLSTRTAAEAQALRQRVAEIIERRKR